jgi:hypothetical protein
LIWEDWDDISVDAIMAIFNSMEFDIQIEDYEQLLYINIIISAGEFHTLRHFYFNFMNLLTYFSPQIWYFQSGNLIN